MNTVAIVSMKGGTGKTTVAANLGALLTQDKDSNVLMMDFDPRNQLGLHFGMSITDLAGLAQATLTGASWAPALHYRLDRAPFLPFGQLDDDQRVQLEEKLRAEPALLGERLSDPALHDFGFALIDTAPGPSAYLSHVLPHADLVIVVLLADAASFATLPSLQAALARYRPSRPRLEGVHLLLNGMDESKKLSRDIRAAVSAQFGSAVLPFAIHHDQSVREALAFQRPLVDQGPSSQAAAEFRQLAAWVREELARVPEREANPAEGQATAKGRRYG